MSSELQIILDSTLAPGLILPVDADALLDAVNRALTGEHSRQRTREGYAL